MSLLAQLLAGTSAFAAGTGWLTNVSGRTIYLVPVSKGRKPVATLTQSKDGKVIANQTLNPGFRIEVPTGTTIQMDSIYKAGEKWPGHTADFNPFQDMKVVDGKNNDLLGGSDLVLVPAKNHSRNTAEALGAWHCVEQGERELTVIGDPVSPVIAFGPKK